MAYSAAYIETPAAVAQSVDNARIGGEWLEIGSDDFTIDTDTGVWTYTGADTKTFRVWAIIHGDVSSGTVHLTSCIAKNASAMDANSLVPEIESGTPQGWALIARVSLATNDTLCFCTCTASACSFEVDRMAVFIGEE